MFLAFALFSAASFLLHLSSTFFITILVVIVFLLLIFLLDAILEKRRLTAEYSTAIGALKLNGWHINVDLIDLLHTMETDGHLLVGTVQKLIAGNPGTSAPAPAPGSGNPIDTTVQNTN